MIEIAHIRTDFPSKFGLPRQSGLVDELKGEIVFGVVYNPFTKETFWAAKGQGAYLNDKPIHVSPAAEMGNCLFNFGTGPYQKELAPQNFAILQKIYAKCQDIRRTGAASIDLCYVAAGRCEGFFEITLKPWDYAAGSVILTEAGGKITDWSGNPVPFDHGSSIAATNGHIHDMLLAELK